MVFTICEGIPWSPFYVKEFFVTVHKKVFSLHNSIKCLAILYPKSIASLLVKVETKHSRQVLLSLLWMNRLSIPEDVFIFFSHWNELYMYAYKTTPC